MSDPEATPAHEDVQQDETPAGLQRRWALEINAAKKDLEEFATEGDKVVREYLGKREHANKRLNLYHADIETRAANLSGLPRIRARRRFADAKDDVARVSATTLERLLNTDIERDSDGYRKALRHSRSDWMMPGLGQVRLRYVVETEPATDPSTGQPLTGADGQPMMRKKREDVETDYVKWRRFLWSPCEVWSDDCRWIAYGLDLTREEWDKQFKGKPFHPKTKSEGKDADVTRVFGRAEVWEIWDKDKRWTLFYAEEQEEILKVVKDDPLGLPGFWPSPEPLMANLTTTKCIPRSSYYLAEDLYEEAHEIERRIRKLVKQVKVAGAYDAANDGLQRILDDATDGKLIPVKNWQSLVDKGGLQGAVAFLPMKETVEAIVALSQRLALVKQEIYEVSGQSNTMRGQADPNATATAERVMARFGSSRIQAQEEDLARFATEAQQIRAFIIAKMFDPETIIRRSNIDQAETIEVPSPPPMPGQPPAPPQTQPNMELIGKAIEMLKSDISAYRIDVDAESLSMTDFDAVQQEGVAIMTASAEYFQRWAPLMVQPKVAKFAIEMYQQLISGFRGADKFEPVIDRFVADMEEMANAPPPPPQPDPKAEADKAKAQVEIQKAGMDMQASQLEHGARMQQIHAEMAQDRAKTQNELARATVAPPNGEIQ
jgi:hypothetical protein